MVLMHLFLYKFNTHITQTQFIQSRFIQSLSEKIINALY